VGSQVGQVQETRFTKTFMCYVPYLTGRQLARDGSGKGSRLTTELSPGSLDLPYLGTHSNLASREDFLPV